MIGKIRHSLGDEADYLLGFDAPKIPKGELHLPGPDWVSRIFIPSDRPAPVLKNLQAIFTSGRLGGTGYLSILPVDQGIEHSAGASFAPNREYFDPENIIKLAIEAECNAVASSLGVMGMVARKYAHHIPFIMKINHNELLSYPNKWDQILFASVEQGFNLGAVAIGATIYFGAPPPECHITEVSRAFEIAHDMGMATVLWCYLRNPAFTVDSENYETSADLTGQADYLGANIEADLIKQKQPEMNAGYAALNRDGVKFGKYDKRMYGDMASDHPIDLTRYQVMNNFMGRIGLINSGGASGENDMAAAVRAAVINKRAGGMGLISGRKTFQRPMKEGIEIFRAIQDVYLSPEVTVA
ncbi:MAG: fructose-bisphosphate aldolase [Actinobacteria bacterium RBG_19FT_COMBO_54_7]|uniref:fructose-bisphosphate aldolase n=1 Tax=Candidatus Solincola sediminis TaxID=1797199 RepID=A0A1F2WKB9_9ACTN|nr:MAG: fructose-bisphosphate aldolase [Candidatus Solincola sediminis]OFW58797.1 MAG: fructose-bisphosphate aldolase [Candidatus Solincola sediminis]OFW67868.1 MAG: fructose-bisphosphate aldolase [Actinobacteria bacterium RBG_19FT_COMBO_54_7]